MNSSWLKLFGVVFFLFSFQVKAKALNLELLQGRYNYVPTADTSLICPEILNVTYDPQAGTVDSELFRYIVGKKQNVGSSDSGIETTPDHAGYTDQWTKTKVTSDSIVTQEVNHSASSNTSAFDNEPPGSANIPFSVSQYHVVDSWSVKTARLKFNSKTGFLKQTVTWDNFSVGPNCAYQKIQN